jgi:hypothetical protein
MDEKALAIETKMRGLTAEMTRPEGLKMLELLLERSTTDEIVEAVKLTKLTYEVDKIAARLGPATDF